MAWSASAARRAWTGRRATRAFVGCLCLLALAYGPGRVAVAAEVPNDRPEWLAEPEKRPHPVPSWVANPEDRYPSGSKPVARPAPDAPSPAPSGTGERR